MFCTTSDVMGCSVHPHLPVQKISLCVAAVIAVTDHLSAAWSALGIWGAPGNATHLLMDN